MILQTRVQKGLVSELQPFEIENFDLGHPVVKVSYKVNNIAGNKSWLPIHDSSMNRFATKII